MSKAEHEILKPKEMARFLCELSVIIGDDEITNMLAQCAGYILVLDEFMQKTCGEKEGYGSNPFWNVEDESNIDVHLP